MVPTLGFTNYTSDVNTSEASFCHRLNTVRTVTTTIAIVAVVKKTSKYLVVVVFFGSSHLNMLRTGRCVS